MRETAHTWAQVIGQSSDRRVRTCTSLAGRANLQRRICLSHGGAAAMARTVQTLIFPLSDRAFGAFPNDSADVNTKPACDGSC